MGHGKFILEKNKREGQDTQRPFVDITKEVLNQQFKLKTGAYTKSKQW